jgi:hypothetical protein
MNTEIVHWGCRRRKKKSNAAMKGADHRDERREEGEDNGQEEKLDNDSGQAEGEERSGYSER